jgi:hypothetical protein
MKKFTLFTVFALIIVSCAPEIPPIHTVIIVDSTVVNLAALQQQAMYRFIGKQPRNASISVLVACGKEVNTIYDGQIGEKLAIFQKFSTLIKPCTSTGSPITESLTQAAILLGEHDQTALIFISDGGLTDDPKVSDFPSAANQLAAVKGLKAVWIAGAGSFNELRSSFKEQLRPVLGNRLIVSGMNDLDAGFDAFTEKIKN